MVSIDRLCTALNKERVRIQKDLGHSGLYMMGIAQGITIAISIAREVYEQHKHQQAHNPMGKRKVA